MGLLFVRAAPHLPIALPVETATERNGNGGERMNGIVKLVVAGALAAWGGNAWAITQGACQPDVQKFCADVQPGQGAVLECLDSHKSDLSPKCAGNMTEVRQTLKQFSKACESDVEKYCWDAPAGVQGLASCLKLNKDELSTGCKTAISNAKGLQQ
jgi:hypothetical protein